MKSIPIDDNWTALSDQTWILLRAGEHQFAREVFLKAPEWRRQGAFEWSLAQLTHYEGDEACLALFSKALDRSDLKTFKVTDYRSHAIRGGSDSDSAAYVQVQSLQQERVVWGCGIDPSIEMAGLRALVSAVNLLRNLDPE